MFECGIRVGNENSAEGYVTKIKAIEGQFIQTYGLTTLKPEHITFNNDKMFLDFLGKKAVHQSIEINDKFLIEWGQFFYEKNKEKETWLDISNYDITKFVKKYIGSKFVPKDFRTITANRIATKLHEEISERDKPQKKKEAKKELKEIVEKTAEFLGNTPGICKKAYIDNRLLEFHYKQRYGEDLNVKKKKRKN